MIDYTDKNRQEALNKIESFSSDFGGTNIQEPICDAFFKTDVGKDVQKRVFLLTDGQIYDKDSVILIIEQACSKDDSTKVFSFGISSGCDQDLIKRSAEAGQGAESILMD